MINEYGTWEQREDGLMILKEPSQLWFDDLKKSNNRLYEIKERLLEIDKAMSEARVIIDIMNGNEPHQRVLDLIQERENLLNELKGL